MARHMQPSETMSRLVNGQARIIAAPPAPSFRHRSGTFVSTRAPAGGLAEAAARERHCVLRLTLAPGLQIVQDALRFVTAYARQRFASRTAERVALASCELLANALNYGRIGRDVVYELHVSFDQITVQVSNAAIVERIDMLKKHLARIDADPTNTFEAEKTRSAAANAPRAMLGLARVRHEASMALSVTVVRDIVTTHASCLR